jgi:hypothetical protein
LWTPLSWIATMALVNLGWIFFRANSLPQARQMLAAVVSLASYGSRSLSGTLYVLVTAFAIGYALILWMLDVLDCSSDEAHLSEHQSVPRILRVMARWRWFWIPPLYALALLFLLLITGTQGASTAQFMYNKF